MALADVSSMCWRWVEWKCGRRRWPQVEKSSRQFECAGVVNLGVRLRPKAKASRPAVRCSVFTSRLPASQPRLRPAPWRQGLLVKLYRQIYQHSPDRRNSTTCLPRGHTGVRPRTGPNRCLPSPNPARLHQTSHDPSSTASPASLLPLSLLAERSRPAEMR